MKSKRGVALAYVIVVTAALLVVAAAIAALATYNLSVSQNSLEGRQAYLDARSAIEFGRAYLAENPDSDGFYIIRSTSTFAESGFAVSADATGSIAFYDKAHGTINAKVPYSATHDRFRLLSYHIGGGDVPSPSSGGSSSGDSDNPQYDYLVCGGGYGTNRVFDRINQNDPRIEENRKSDYPVVVRNMMQGDNGWDTAHSLTAPEIYLLCQPTSFAFYDTCYAELHSNFICIGGSSITGQDYRSSYSDTSKHYSTLMLMTNPPGGTGVLCFTQDCTLLIDKDQPNSPNARTVQIPKGYYSFRDGTNIYDLTSSNFTSLMTKLNTSDLPSNVSTKRVDYISNNYTSFLAGGYETWNYGTVWTDDAGVLANGHPSNQDNGGRGYSFSSNMVFFYITSCQDWTKAMTKWDDHDTGVYAAKSIYMRYVNSSENFMIPSSKKIVFQADKIWMNTARSDTSPGGDVPITGGSSGSSFLLQSVSGSGPFELDVPAELTVNYTNLNGTAKSYRIKAGTYQLMQPINLLNDSAPTTLSASYKG